MRGGECGVRGLGGTGAAGHWVNGANGARERGDVAHVDPVDRQGAGRPGVDLEQFEIFHTVPPQGRDGCQITPHDVVQCHDLLDHDGGLEAGRSVIWLPG
jgi:hypothetical protein